MSEDSMSLTDQPSDDQPNPIVAHAQNKAAGYRRRAAYEREHGTERSYHRMLAMAVALEEFAREIS